MRPHRFHHGRCRQGRQTHESHSASRQERRCGPTNSNRAWLSISTASSTCVKPSTSSPAAPPTSSQVAGRRRLGHGRKTLQLRRHRRRRHPRPTRHGIPLLRRLRRTFMDTEDFEQHHPGKRAGRRSSTSAPTAHAPSSSTKATRLARTPLSRRPGSSLTPRHQGRHRDQPDERGHLRHRSQDQGPALHRHRRDHPRPHRRRLTSHASRRSNSACCVRSCSWACGAQVSPRSGPCSPIRSTSTWDLDDAVLSDSSFGSIADIVHRRLGWLPCPRTRTAEVWLWALDTPLSVASSRARRRNTHARTLAHCSNPPNFTASSLPSTSAPPRNPRQTHGRLRRSPEPDRQGPDRRDPRRLQPTRRSTDRSPTWSSTSTRSMRLKP